MENLVDDKRTLHKCNLFGVKILAFEPRSLNMSIPVHILSLTFSKFLELSQTMSDFLTASLGKSLALLDGH